MANELTVDILFRYTKDAVARTFPRLEQNIDVAGENLIASHKNIGVAPEVLPVDEVAVNGWWIFANRSTTTGENITIQDGAGNPACIIYPGEMQSMRLPFAPSAVSAAGTPRLEYWGLDP